MPEGPEVENVVRTLAPKLTGRTILHAIGTDAPVAGRLITGVQRYGKYIVVSFADTQATLQVHLRMTGKLLFNGERTPYTRAEFALDEGLLLFDDIRRFGRIRFSEALPDQGPDPLEMDADAFVQHLKRRKGRIKPALLNQQILRGLGNIYADEALFAAGIRPLALLKNIAPHRLRQLHASIVAILREAIAAGGSSISDYVDAEGREGSFQDRHQVYGKNGQPCPKCGGPIQRIVVGQRGTHYCVRCQR